MNNTYSNIVEAVSDLKEKGYSNSFVLTKEGLYSYDSKETFSPDMITISEFHRFEGITNLDDMSILYVLETNNGTKGIIIDAFGTYADSALGDFLKKIKVKKEGEEESQSTNV